MRSVSPGEAPSAKRSTGNAPRSAPPAASLDDVRRKPRRVTAAEIAGVNGLFIIGDFVAGLLGVPSEIAQVKIRAGRAQLDHLRQVKARHSKSHYVTPKILSHFCLCSVLNGTNRSWTSYAFGRGPETANGRMARMARQNGTIVPFWFLQVVEAEASDFDPTLFSYRNVSFWKADCAEGGKDRKELGSRK
jgi:hypothetical protein